MIFCRRLSVCHTITVDIIDLESSFLVCSQVKSQVCISRSSSEGQGQSIKSSMHTGASTACDLKAVLLIQCSPTCLLLSSSHVLHLYRFMNVLERFTSTRIVLLTLHKHVAPVAVSKVLDVLPVFCFCAWQMN